MSRFKPRKRYSKEDWVNYAEAQLQREHPAYFGYKNRRGIL